MAFALPVIAVAAIIIGTIFSYDGKCGGFFPALAGPKPCTLSEYVAGNLSLLILIAGAKYWPLIIAAIALPIVIGYVMDLHEQHHNIG